MNGRLTAAYAYLAVGKALKLTRFYSVQPKVCSSKWIRANCDYRICP